MRNFPRWVLISFPGKVNVNGRPPLIINPIIFLHTLIRIPQSFIATLKISSKLEETIGLGEKCLQSYSDLGMEVWF